MPSILIGSLSIGQGQIWAFFTQGQVTPIKVGSPIWLEFDLIQNFMAVLVTCKIDEDRIKSEVAIIQTFSPLQVYGKNFRRSWVSNSTVNSPIWPEIEIIRDFMAVLVTCKFDEAPIKNEVVIDQTLSPS